jgi:hypothetical protein
LEWSRFRGPARQRQTFDNAVSGKVSLLNELFFYAANESGRQKNRPPDLSCLMFTAKRRASGGLSADFLLSLPFDALLSFVFSTARV